MKVLAPACDYENLIFNVPIFYQYQDDITELNEIAKHRPRSHLVIGIAQENRQIRELQQENRELRLALEEHQSALELIMKKYREQVNTLIETNKLEKAIACSKDQSMVRTQRHLRHCNSFYIRPRASDKV